jgi:hypothetical protein
MTMSSNTTSSGGLGFGGALLLLFVALKLTKIVTWSWWWVLSPAWIPITLGVLIGLFVVVFGRN